jgi:hypothetical protein
MSLKKLPTFSVLHLNMYGGLVDVSDGHFLSHFFGAVFLLCLWRCCAAGVLFVLCF